MIKVVTFLWHDSTWKWAKKFQYTAEHVNKLKNAVKRNLKLDHEFVCITDSATGIDGDIRIVPLWRDFATLGGCYRRLKAFSSEMQHVIGERFICLDLDAVILRDITPIVDRFEDFVILKDWSPRAKYNGSMWMMNAGARSHVWELFHENPAAAVAVGKQACQFGTDQGWLAASLKDEAVWTEADGVYSYRWHVKGKGLPKDARIVFFHGPFDPSQKEMQRFDWVRGAWC